MWHLQNSSTEGGGGEDVNTAVFPQRKEIACVASDEVSGFATYGGGKEFVVVGVGGGGCGGKMGGGFGQFPQDEGDIEEEIAEAVFVAEVGTIENVQYFFVDVRTCNDCEFL